ncbi:scavenger receptor cysteine-rich type 1 protein M130, partial [Gadus macrocephalus]|uniref:scavenger receptor cysteine-rich type 1 protein M130 n=1 Tax=Gadus macrocephalus TaxID=80720 RepID=UPI0028CB5CCC
TVNAEQNRLMLHGGKHPCEGYVRLYIKGQWGSVGSDGWTKTNEDVVCKSIGCGTSLRSADIPLTVKAMGKVWLNKIKCNGTEAHLWDCPGTPGLGVGEYDGDMVKRITCSEEVELGLKGYRCAGAVYYYYKKNENKETYFCDNWDRGDHFTDKLCQKLNCSGMKKNADVRIFTKPVLPPEYRQVSTKCTGTKEETHAWQCNPKEERCNRPAIVVCQGMHIAYCSFSFIELFFPDHHVFRIKGGKDRCSGTMVWRNGTLVNCNMVVNNSTCEEMRCGDFNSSTCDKKRHMLTCSDKIKIVLANVTFGKILVDGPMGKMPVCASEWKHVNSKVVCKELGFGEVIDTSFTIGRTEAILDKVTCSGDEESLWDCTAEYSKGKPQPCNNVTSVICGASLEGRLADGPGRCAGRLEMKLGGDWFRVAQQWSEDNSHVVCKELRCGKALLGKTLDKISQGSLPYLDKLFACGKTSDKLSTCPAVASESKQQNPQLTMLVCEDHLEVFLNGSSWCEGLVGVRQHDNSFWLSGSNATWTQAAADLVCQQMHCGSAKDHDSRDSSEIPGTNLWPREYKCSSKEKSLFDCPSSKQTDNSTIAFVRCAGQITLRLKSHCSGDVEVCVNNTCGGVCLDSWSDAKSKELCESVDGCGHYISDLVGPGESRQSIPPIVKSLHFHPVFGKSLVMNEGRVCTGSAAVVTCSGSLKAEMAPSRDYCSGIVKLYSNSKPYSICNDSLTTMVQGSICNELDCGESESLESLPWSPDRGRNALSVVAFDCPAANKSMANCIPSLKKMDCSEGRLRCSGWRRLVLKGEAGACEGLVFKYSQDPPVAVSSQGWTEAEGERLCRDLGCAGYKNHTDYPCDQPLWGIFNCSGVDTPKNIWDCLRSESPAGSETLKRLYLTCKGHRNATLSKHCRGDVSLNKMPVATHGWTKANANRVCKENHDCGDAFEGQESSGGKAADRALQVSCLGPEDRLGHCMTSEVAPGGQTVSVFCRKAFKFNTTEKCGGRVKVQYPEGEWQTMCLHGTLYDKGKQNLCDLLNCGKPISIPPESPLIPAQEEKQGDLKMSLNCTQEHVAISYCVRNDSCNGFKAAEIYCKGYVAQLPPEETDLQLPVGVAAGTVALLLTVGVFFLLRRHILRTGIPKRRDMEVETSDYDDVGSSVNGKGSLSRMDSRSLPAEVQWNDSDEASQSYDDIAEEGPGETLSLMKGEAPEEETPEVTSYSDVVPSSKAADSGSHGVDILEDNDDVLEPGPKIAGTAAEADSGLRTPHRELPEVPPDDMEGDHEYLEQDPLG